MMKQSHLLKLRLERMSSEKTFPGDASGIRRCQWYYDHVRAGPSIFSSMQLNSREQPCPSSDSD